MSKNKKRLNKYIASAAAAAIVVAPIAATPTEAASTTGVAVTNDINALAAAATATEAFYAQVATVRADYNGLSANQKTKVTAATLTKLTNAEAAVTIMKNIAALDVTDAALQSKTAAIRTQFNALPLAGKLLVKNIADLTAAETQAMANATNAAAALKVTTQINALGATPTALAVTNARAAYTKLTAEQQPFVTQETLDKLTAAEAYIATKAQNAANALAKADTYVANVDAIAEADDRGTAIATAEAGALTAAEQALLTTEKAAAVTAAAKTLANYKAAQAVADKIAVLALSDDFAAYTAAVAEARALFNSLPLAQKLLVNNLEELTTEEAIVALGEEKAQETVNPDVVEAKKVSALITALPAVGTETAADEASVLAAKAAFDELSLAGQALVEQALQEKLTALIESDTFKTAQAVVEFEAKVAAIKDKTASNVLPAIEALTTAYGALEDAPKEIVDTNGNYAKVVTAKTHIEAINAAVAAIPADLSTVTDDQLTALVAAQTAVNALPEDTKVYVRNIAAVNSKVTATESALRAAAKNAITAIKTAAADLAALNTAIEAAEAAVAKLAVISGVADFATATDAEKATVTSKLTNYEEIAYATAAAEVVEQIDGIIAYDVDTLNFAAAIASNKELRAAYDGLHTKAKPYVQNVSTLTTNEGAVNAAYEGLKTAANNAIVALDDATDATTLGTAIETATDAVANYTDVYVLLNTDQDEAAGQATLTNHANIALAEAAKPVVEAVEALAYTAANPVDAPTLNTAIGAYNSVKATVTEEMSVNSFFVTLGETKYEAAAGEITTSIATLATAADTVIGTLKTPAPQAVDAFEGIIGSSKTAADVFATPYNSFNGTSEADFTAITKYGDIALAEAAVPTIKLYDALAYTAPALDAYDADAFNTAVDALNEANDSATLLTGDVKAFIFNASKVTDQQNAIDATLQLLLGDVNTKIAAITAGNAATPAAMQTAIDDATNAFDVYEAAFQKVNGATADATAEVTNYGNIALAQAAHAIMVTFASLSYTAEDAATYTTDSTMFTTAATAYNAAKEVFEAVDSDVQNFVFNKADKFDANFTALKGTVTNLQAASANANAAIQTTANAAGATVETVQDAITVAETAYETFTTAFQALNGEEVEVPAVDDYANIADATAALVVAEEIVTALAATDAADTTKVNERLTTLNEALAKFNALETDEVKGFVFNKDELDTEIAELDPEYAERVDLLIAAEAAITALVANKDAAQVQTLITAATEAVEAYTATTIDTSAAAEAVEADVIGFANIALYEAALPTITAIQEITTATEADKEAKVTTARDSYDALETAQQKAVVNYSVLTEAEGGIEAKIEEAKQAAADAIAALKTQTTAQGLADQIVAANQAIDAYVALNTAFTQYDVPGTEDLEYAESAKVVVDLIAALTADSEKAAVEEVRAEYEVLSENVQAYVVNLGALEALEAAVEAAEEEAQAEQQSQENTAAAGDFDTKFAALASVTGATYASVLSEAVTAYEALTDEQKALVTVENAAVKLANYKAAEPVVTAIQNIGSIDALTTADIAALEQKVTPTRTAFTALSLASKLLVVNLQELTAAESKLSALKVEKINADKAAADNAVVDAFTAKVDALDSMDIDSAAYVKAVKDARTAYNALALKYKLAVTPETRDKLANHELNI